MSSQSEILGKRAISSMVQLLKHTTKTIEDSHEVFKLGSKLLIKGLGLVKNRQVSVFTLKVAEINGKFYILTPIEGEVVSCDEGFYQYDPNNPLTLDDSTLEGGGK